MADADAQTLLTEQLHAYSAVCLLGSAGLGKTNELRLLAEAERRAGGVVLERSVAALATDATALRNDLMEILFTVRGPAVVFLDSLDEAMVSVRMAATIIENWIERARDRDIAVRVACRSTVWPSFLLSKLVEVHGKDSVCVAELLSLDEDQVRQVADDEGLESTAFWNDVKESGAEVLAARPLTLRLLVDEFRSTGRIAVGGRAGLFERAVQRLCGEQSDRFERNTARHMTGSGCVGVSEDIATVAMLSGSESIQRPGVDRHTVGAIPQDVVSTLWRGSVDPYAPFETGLFTREGDESYAFVHRQMAEYLAARRIAKLPLPTAQALLGEDGDDHARIGPPLQEIAAWAAGMNQEIAAWVTRVDPEIIGRSDIADDRLRKKALESVARLFREGRLTQSRLHEDEMLVTGYAFAGVDGVLRSLLSEPHAGLEDLHAFAIKVAAKNRVVSMAEELAHIANDSRWALATRTLSARAVEEIGRDDAIRALRPLAVGVAEDSEDDLKGIALRSLWPQSITSPELLSALTPPRRRNYLGPYKYFLWLMLNGQITLPLVDESAVRWATKTLATSDSHGPLHSIAGVIAYKALDLVSDEDVLSAVVDHIIGSVTAGGDPFHIVAESSISLRENDRTQIAKRFADEQVLRRRLIRCICRATEDEFLVFQAVRSVPGLLQLEDFTWMLDSAVALSGSVATNFANIAAWLPWLDCGSCVESLYGYLQSAEIANHFPSLHVRLDSEEARRLREYHQLGAQAEPTPRPKVDRARLVAKFVRSAEEDPCRFARLCRVLSVDESGHSRYERFVTQTEGWAASDNRVRERIVDVARRLLVECPSLSRDVTTMDLSTIPLNGVMESFFLLTQKDPDYLPAVEDAVWDTWSRHIIRELRYRLDREPLGPKKTLMRMVLDRRPLLVLQSIGRLARTTKAETTLRSVLEAVEEVENEALDDKLADLIANKRVGGERLSVIMEFALRRDATKAGRSCIAGLRCHGRGAISRRSVLAAVNLLLLGPDNLRTPVLDFLEKWPRLSRPVLSALSERVHIETDFLNALSVQQQGQMLRLLFVSFPPKDDPVHDGAHWVDSVDSAIFLRQRLLSHLSELGDPESVDILRELETVHGTEYPWLRYPRSDAERRAREIGWRPVNPREIAWVLTDESARVLRSESDLMRLVVEAVHEFGNRLSGSLSLAQNLWNTPREEPPSPKEEELVSDNLMDVIQSRLAKYSTLAVREAQIRRRILSEKLGGEKGQKADVLVKALSPSEHSEALHVVVEVKNSYNPECKTALREQLVNRYLLQNGWTHGLFVVAYLDAPGNRRRPVWPSVDRARSYLERQASQIMAEIDAVRIQTIVVDASIQ